MTCIVGIVEQGKVHIGADSAAVGGLDVTNRKDPKVFKVGEFILGCTSSFRMIQLLRFSLCPPKRHADQDVYEYMCTGFVNAVRDCLKSGGYAETDRSAEVGGTFLVGYAGRLFKIESDYQVGESLDSFQSCGCGQAYALGALSVLSELTDVHTRITKALEVATYHSAGVRPPYIIESI